MEEFETEEYTIKKFPVFKLLYWTFGLLAVLGFGIGILFQSLGIYQDGKIELMLVICWAIGMPGILITAIVHRIYVAVHAGAGFVRENKDEIKSQFKENWEQFKRNPRGIRILGWIFTVLFGLLIIAALILWITQETIFAIIVGGLLVACMCLGLTSAAIYAKTEKKKAIAEYKKKRADAESNKLQKTDSKPT